VEGQLSDIVNFWRGFKSKFELLAHKKDDAMQVLYLGLFGLLASELLKH